jgi:hypothetical protein
VTMRETDAALSAVDRSGGAPHLSIGVTSRQLVRRRAELRDRLTAQIGRHAPGTGQVVLNAADAQPFPKDAHW